MSTPDRKSGFTIIEVVLVLAVAGLIFLVVFAAIPRLQASRRDNQRKRDAEAIFSLMIEYQSNTGSLPTTSQVINTFAATPVTTEAFYSYVSPANLSDPSSGSAYVRVASNNPVEGQFYHLSPGICVNNTGLTGTGAPGNSGAFLFGLERGEYCIEI